MASTTLQRGDLITGINGRALQYNDVQRLLTSGIMLNLTINYTDDITIILNQNYQENPLFLSKTLEADGKK